MWNPISIPVPVDVLLRETVVTIDTQIGTLEGQFYVIYPYKEIYFKFLRNDDKGISGCESIFLEDMIRYCNMSIPIDIPRINHGRPRYICTHQLRPFLLNLSRVWQSDPEGSDTKRWYKELRRQ